MLSVALATGGCEDLLPQRTAGEKLYRKHCADCHGLDAGGQTVRHMGDQYANLRDNMWRHGGSGKEMIYTLQNQLVFRHPTWDELSPEEIRRIVNHVLKLRGEVELDR